MKRNDQSRSTPTTDSHKASIHENPAQDSFVLISQVNGILTQGLNTAQLMRSLFEGSIAPSDVAFKMVKSNNQEDSNFKVSSILSCPTESESVLAVCNPEDIHEGAAGTNGAQIIMDSEGLSC